MSDTPHKEVDFMKILCSKNSSVQDLKNIIAGHVHASLTVLSDVLESEYEEKELDKIKKIMAKSFNNLQKFDKMESTELKNYYSRVLKSQLLFFCYCDSFLKAETDFFPLINGIKVDDPKILKSSLQDVYLCSLANFSNSIGSETFIACDSDTKTIKSSLKLLKIDSNDERTRKFFQRSITRNGFISPYDKNKTSKDIVKLFDVKTRFDFSKFVNIFSKRTSKKADDFQSAVLELLAATKETPLLFLNRFSTNPIGGLRYTRKNPPSFISSPPHAYESLLIDKLAILCMVPADEETDEEEDKKEEEEEEDKNESKKYLQLLAANRRFKDPPVQSPETKIFKHLGIKPIESELPSDYEIRGTCSLPFYYNLNDDEEDSKDKIKGELINKDQQARLRKSYYTGVIDGLHPIEVQLARILEFSALNKYHEKNANSYESIFNSLFKDVADDANEIQIKISRSIISSMLFPDTRIGLSQDSTDLFILSVFSELFKLLESSKVHDANAKLNDFFVPGKVRRVFQLAMDGIIPAVYQNIVKLADWTQGKKTSIDYDDDPNDDKNHSIYPFSAPIFLKKFILDPSLRRRCPVIYTYLRLHSRFCLTNRIPIIASLLSRIWDKYCQKLDDVEPENTNSEEEEIDDGKNFADLGIEDDELKEFLSCWKGALEFIDSGPLTEKARKRLAKTMEIAEQAESEDCPENLAEETHIRPFLPYDPSSWPGLIVLESLSEAHNEFISVLQQHCKIHSFDVNDKDFNKSKVLDTTIFGQFFSRAVRGYLGPDSLPIFNEEVEKIFLQQAALLPYYYIIHPIINCVMKEDITMGSKGLVTLYEERFDTMDLSEEQKKMLHIYIKEADKTAGALLLVSKFMYSALDDHNSTNGNNFQSSTPLSAFIEKCEITKTPIENESYSALLIAKGKLKEDFKVGQFSKMYTFLSEPIDQCKKAFSLQEAIIRNVITECEIKEGSIDNIQLQNVDDYRPYFTVIPKIFADLLREKKISKENVAITPTQVIDLWNEIKEDKRMLIDKDELATLDAIKKLDEGKNNNKLVTLISYFNDAKVNYNW